MRRFLPASGGNVAMVFALLLPVLFCSVGLGVDFQARVAQKAALQSAADTLALRGARELLLENSTSASIAAMLRATAARQFESELGVFGFTPDVNTAEDYVTVEISQPSRKAFFMSQFVPQEDPIIVDATAAAQGMTNVCVIALEDEAANAISAQRSSKLDAPNCALLSNSKSPTGVTASSFAKLTAAMICSAGGASGASANFSPMPILDCPQYDDPLAKRTPPSTTGCDYNNATFGVAPSSRLLALIDAIVSTVNGATEGTLVGYERFDLQPGVYCGGITINGKSDAHLAPGEYIIKDGPLIVDTGARLYGVNAGFYLTGDASVFSFNPMSIIHLTAPKTGLMAGLLVWEDNAAPEGREHIILSSNARELLGTFYLPQGVLRIESGMAIGDASAYTAIVARALRLNGAPKLVLNTDYSATDVPTPAGIGPTGGAVFLRE